jgi:hypothetical protein
MAKWKMTDGVLAKEGRRVVYLTKEGLKLGSAKNKALSPPEVLSRLSKGFARKVRKAARKVGRLDIARSRRVPLTN